MRARKKKWAPAELAENPLIIKNEAERISLRAHFNTPAFRGAFAPAPIHVEIGCGKGRFITESARRNPHIHYLGIEREGAVLAAAARRGTLLLEETKAAQGPPPSLAFLLMDVSELASTLTPGEISRLYINFCDPWPRKKKWAKRRLTHPSFLHIYKTLAIPEIHFKTDNRLLFEFSLESFSRAGWQMQNISLDLHAHMPDDNIVTEYEEKFAQFGPIYRLEAFPPAI